MSKKKKKAGLHQRNWFLWVWQTTCFYILIIDRSAQLIGKSVFNAEWKMERNQLTDREDRWPFTGLQLSRLHTPKPGKCQVFLKNVRSYISLLFIPPFFPLFLLLSWPSPLFDACLSQIMSAPLGWVVKCDPPSVFCASTPSSTSCLSSSSPLYLVPQICSCFLLISPTAPRLSLSPALS